MSLWKNTPEPLTPERVRELVEQAERADPLKYGKYATELDCVWAYFLKYLEDTQDDRVKRVSPVDGSTNYGYSEPEYEAFEAAWLLCKHHYNIHTGLFS